MTHFLRTEKNKTIVDCDCFFDQTTKTYDFNVTIPLREYTDFVFNLEKDKRNEFAKDMERIDEFREEYFGAGQNKDNKKSDNIDSFLKKNLIEIGKKWSLSYVSD